MTKTIADPAIMNAQELTTVFMRDVNPVMKMAILTMPSMVKLSGHFVFTTPMILYSSTTTFNGGFIGRSTNPLFQIVINNSDNMISLSNTPHEKYLLTESIGGVIGKLSSNLFLSSLNLDVEIKIPIESTAEDFHINTYDSYDINDALNHTRKGGTADGGLDAEMVKPFLFALLSLLNLTKTLHPKYLSHEHHNELNISACLASSITLPIFSV